MSPLQQTENEKVFILSSSYWFFVGKSRSFYVPIHSSKGTTATRASCQNESAVKQTQNIPEIALFQIHNGILTKIWNIHRQIERIKCTGFHFNCKQLKAHRIALNVKCFQYWMRNESNKISNHYSILFAFEAHLCSSFPIQSNQIDWRFWINKYCSSHQWKKKWQSILRNQPNTWYTAISAKTNHRSNFGRGMYTRQFYRSNIYETSYEL